MNIGYCEGNHGEKSSKRLNGTILIWAAVFIAFISSLCSLFFIVPGAKLIEVMVITMGSLGCGLNGTTLLEKGIKKFRSE